MTKRSLEEFEIPPEYETLSPDQKSGFNTVLQGHNCCIIGPAGTGKSYLVKLIIKTLELNGIEVAVTSSTGISASNLNCGATTFHSFVGCSICKGLPEEEVSKMHRYNRKAESKWGTTSVLFIDEISMLSPLFFEKAEAIARLVRRNSRTFGGLQIVCCGDWAQLKPVPERVFQKGFEHIKVMEYCFETPSWERSIKKTIMLTTNYRQNKDKEFLDLLGEARIGKLSHKSHELLRSRVGAKLVIPHGIRPTILLPKRKDVDAENEKQLGLLPSPLFQFKLKRATHGNLTESEEKAAFAALAEIQADELVELKEGASVILTVNLDTENGFVNGLQGVIKKLTNEGALVMFVGKEEPTEIGLYTWWSEADNKKKKTKGDDEFRGASKTQIPLKLAFSLTIHKSQSMTLEFVILDLGVNVFAEGQAYTGLSRCKTLAGLSLQRYHPDSIKINPKVIKYYQAYGEMMERLDDEMDQHIAKKLMMESSNYYTESGKDSSELWENEDDKIEEIVKKTPRKNQSPQPPQSSTPSSSPSNQSAHPSSPSSTPSNPSNPPKFPSPPVSRNETNTRTTTQKCLF